MMEEVDTSNPQFVGCSGDYIVILAPKQRMTKDEALLHAAWLVALADDEDRFSSVLTAVQNT